MIADIRTVMWKERKGLFRFRGSRGRFWLTMLSPMVLAIVFPYQIGENWVSEMFPLVLAFIIPAILVGLTVPDSFAGERERHTLQTLLASRLPDRAILWGKLAVSMLFGWGVTMLLLFISLVVVNIGHWQGHVLLFTVPIGLGCLGLSVLASALAGGLGVLMSLRSETVQEAAQKLMSFFLVPPILLQVVLLVFRDQLGNFIESVNGPQLLVIVLAVFAALTAIVILLAMRSFRRSRLALI